MKDMHKYIIYCETCLFGCQQSLKSFGVGYHVCYCQTGWVRDARLSGLLSGWAVGLADGWIRWQIQWPSAALTCDGCSPVILSHMSPTFPIALWHSGDELWCWGVWRRGRNVREGQCFRSRKATMRSQTKLHNQDKYDRYLSRLQRHNQLVLKWVAQHEIKLKWNWNKISSYFTRTTTTMFYFSFISLAVVRAALDV